MLLTKATDSGRKITQPHKLKNVFASEKSLYLL